MPGPGASPSRCVFQGSAAAVRLRGSGPAVLTAEAAFTAPQAARVELVNAKIGAVTPDVLNQPAVLEPVGPNPTGATYDVTYWSSSPGHPVTLRVDGGGAPGRFRGSLAGAAECAASACAIAWTEGKPKTVALYPAGDGALAITGAFPAGPRGTDASARLDEVTLEGATGTMRCGDEAVRFDRETLRWSAADPVGLEVAPLRVEGATLRVEVRSEAGPIRLSRLLLGGMIVTVLLVLGAIALALFRTRNAPGAR